jgi:hypothetical protein
MSKLIGCFIVICDADCQGGRLHSLSYIYFNVKTNRLQLVSIPINCCKLQGFFNRACIILYFYLLFRFMKITVINIFISPEFLNPSHFKDEEYV